MAKTLRVGVIGCGNISTTYFKYAPLFKGMAITACADLNQQLAEDKALEYGLAAMTPKALIASKDIDIVSVSEAVGKHANGAYTAEELEIHQCHPLQANPQRRRHRHPRGRPEGRPWNA